MNDDKKMDSATTKYQISGHLARRLNPAPIRILAIVTGFALLRGIFALIGRFLLVLRRKATATLEENVLTVDVEWSIMGRPFRKTRTTSLANKVDAVQFENRKRYVHLLVGFGFLAIGVWIGIQWLVEGLRAGYPLLALVGAAVVAAGVAIDLILYLFVPEGDGSSRMIVALGPWKMRFSGVDYKDGEHFLSVLKEQWQSKS